MILSDTDIAAAIAASEIVIEPFDLKALGSNSYDVHLSPYVRIYEAGTLDAMVDNPVLDREIGPGGYVLQPGQLYLMSTVEYTRCSKHVPFLDGKSSIGRLGITIHCTAGRGDVGFRGHWTLEVHVVRPVRVYAGMPIGQLIFFETGAVEMPYDEKPNAKYNNRDRWPQTSRMWKNFNPMMRGTAIHAQLEEGPADPWLDEPLSDGELAKMDQDALAATKPFV